MPLLKAPQGVSGDLHLNGRSFSIDKNGQVEVPDDLIISAVWEKGYTVVADAPAKDALVKTELKTASETSKGSKE